MIRTAMQTAADAMEKAAATRHQRQRLLGRMVKGTGIDPPVNDSGGAGITYADARPGSAR